MSKLLISPSGRRSGPPLLISCMLVVTELKKIFFFQKECYVMELLHASEPFSKVSHVASHF